MAGFNTRVSGVAGNSRIFVGQMDADTGINSEEIDIRRINHAFMIGQNTADLTLTFNLNDDTTSGSDWTGSVATISYNGAGNAEYNVYARGK